jgi:hypothetical protein
MESRLFQAIRGDFVALEIMVFASSHHAALGVRGLSACSVVSIFSPHAAIVAYIGPNEIGPTAPDSYIHLATHLMEEVMQLYSCYAAYFQENVKAPTVNGHVRTAPLG